MFKNRQLQVKMVKTPHGELPEIEDGQEFEDRMLAASAAAITTTQHIAKVVGAVMVLNTALKIVESRLSK